VKRIPPSPSSETLVPTLLLSTLLFATHLVACDTGPTSCTTEAAPERDSGPLMDPGGDCIGCRMDEGEEVYTAAGTVMPSLAEEDGCTGVTGATVEITGADGRVLSLQTNSVGNFFTMEPIATPYTAKVVMDGREVAMVSTLFDTNCASCHTERGSAGALGRITGPL
jgi:hypothetical protein